MVTFVYRLHSVITCRPLWVGDDIKGPWMVIGDFNALMIAQDKEGGIPMADYETSDLEVMVQTYNLVDLRSIGCQLTWTNGSVSSKLGRALVNIQWLLANYQSFVKFLSPKYLSYHSYYMVSLLQGEQPKQLTFKLHNLWTMHEGFYVLIEESWEQSSTRKLSSSSNRIS